MRLTLVLIAAVIAMLTATTATAAEGPPAHAAATCSDYGNQREAQNAADTVDADGDGIFCEALPCPCSTGGDNSSSQGDADTTADSERSSAGKHRSKSKASRWHRFDHSRWRITDVVDGDTIKVKKLRGPAPRTNWTVRLIGIDAPSVRQCGGKEAKAALLQRSFTDPKDTDGDGLVDKRGGTGRHVRLRTDLSQDLYDDGDLLAYATTSVGTDLALSQIKRGWSDFFIDADEFDRYDRYVDAAERTLDRAKGSWETCGGDFNLPLT